MPLSRRNLHALTGAYALDALEEGAEQRRFIRHLRRCKACAEEVRRFREVATSLAYEVAAEPPPELRERVMAAVTRTRQLPPVVAPRRFRVWLPRIPPNVWLPRLALASTAVAIAAVVALSIVLSGTTQQLNSVRTQSQAIASVLAAPDARTAAGQVTNGGVVTVLLSAAKRELVVTSTGLAALPADKTYELWLIGPSHEQKSAIRRAGLLPSAVAGLTTPTLASGLVAGDILAMTVEPAGGTSQPTTTPILLLNLSTKATKAAKAAKATSTAKTRGH
jgi:anti-sigma-K factor RskA